MLRMKNNRILVITSLLSLLLLTLHITDDIVRGISKAEPSNTALVVFVVFCVVLLVRPLLRPDIAAAVPGARRVRTLNGDYAPQRA